MYNRGAARNPQGSNKTCEFFLQGKCKFGESCRFVHPGSENSSSSNRFSALSGSNGGSKAIAAGGQATLQPFHIKKEIMIDDLKSERPQWPFSAYAPGRDAPRQLFGGYPLEQSMEEMRLRYYTANAAGNAQTAVQEEQELYDQMSQQIQKILSDPDGAVQYVLAGEEEHPNRRDLAAANGLGQTSANTTGNPFATPTTPSAFGQPATSGTTLGASSFGTGSTTIGSAVQTGGFGQPSQLGVKAAFGQPSQLGGASAFGQPSKLGGTSPFGQPNVAATTSTFGQSSQISAPAFGQQARTTNAAFGQPSMASGTGAFGSSPQPSAFVQPAQPASTLPFGSSTSLGQGSSQSVFGQSSKPNPFAAAPQTSDAFGVNAARSQSPFTDSNQTQTGVVHNSFGQPSGLAASPFSQGINSGQGSQGNPFAQPAQTQANISAIKTPLSHSHPPNSSASHTADATQTPPLQSYARHAGGQLQAWHNRPVTHVDGAPYFVRNGNLHNQTGLERIWFRDGNPQGSAHTDEDDAAYAIREAQGYEQQYRACANQGSFPGGTIPLLAPRRAWVRFDI